MRLTGPLTLTLDASPRLSLYASRAYGDFLGLEIRQDRDGEPDLAELTLFAPPACDPTLRRAVAAFNAEMAKGNPQP